MRRQIVASFAALLLLTACQSRSNQSADAVNAGAGAGAGAAANQGVGQATTNQAGRSEEHTSELQSH